MGATNRSPVPPNQPDPAAEMERSKRLAERYRCSFIDLRDQRIDPELFRSIPAELMFRYNFVPLEAHDHSLAIAVSDPSQVLVNDELSLLLGKKLQIKVATATQIGDILKRTEQSQRVLDQATEGFTLQVVAGRRGERRKHNHGEADARYRRQPRRAPRGYRNLHRPRAPRLRYSHRDRQHRSGREVPH